MQPRDDLAAGSSKWVLTRPGESYIVYTYEATGPMGLKDLASSTYDLLWYDTQTGRTMTQRNVSVGAGEVVWLKPDGLGTEIALFLKRR